MRKAQFLVAGDLSAAVDELYREYGIWRTGRALIAAVWKRRRMKNEIADLSNRMRRDIGVPEIEDAPGGGGYSLWDIHLAK